MILIFLVKHYTMKTEIIRYHLCYDEICNHHRNSLNKELGHRSPDRHTQRNTGRHPGLNT